MIVSSPLLFPWSILDHPSDWRYLRAGRGGMGMSDVEERKSAGDQFKITFLKYI